MRSLKRNDTPSPLVIKSLLHIERGPISDWFLYRIHKSLSIFFLLLSFTFCHLRQSGVTEINFQKRNEKEKKTRGKMLLKRGKLANL